MFGKSLQRELNSDTYFAETRRIVKAWFLDWQASSLVGMGVFNKSELRGCPLENLIADAQEKTQNFLPTQSIVHRSETCSVSVSAEGHFCPVANSSWWRNKKDWKFSGFTEPFLLFSYQCPQACRRGMCMCDSLEKIIGPQDQWSFARQVIVMMRLAEVPDDVSSSQR